MPYIHDDSYHPNLFLRNGHLNTIVQNLFSKKVNLPYSRQEFKTNDQDFFDVDCILNQNKKALVLCHGLEGSSESWYIKNLAKLGNSLGWDIHAINYRSCSGRPNKTLTMYHSGFTKDLESYLKEIQYKYDSIGLIGVSLGGNLVLKYLGEQKEKLNQKIKLGIAISVPLNLLDAIKFFSTWIHKCYEIYFLKTLLKKVKYKSKQFPSIVKYKNYFSINSLYKFDDNYTAPLHGFKNAIDYYNQASCEQYLPKIKIPSYIINSLDDPFMPEKSHPISFCKSSKLITLITSNYGGHVGFFERNKDLLWHELQVKKILNNVL